MSTHMFFMFLVFHFRIFTDNDKIGSVKLPWLLYTWMSDIWTVLTTLNYNQGHRDIGYSEVYDFS